MSRSSASVSRSPSYSGSARTSANVSRSSATVSRPQINNGSSSRSSATTSRSSATSSRSSATASRPQVNNGSSSRSSATASSPQVNNGSSSRSSATTSRSSATSSRSSATASRPQVNNGSSSRSSATTARSSSATSSRSSSQRVAQPIGSSSRSSVARGAADNTRREQSQRVGNATRNGLTTYDKNMSRAGNDVMHETRNDFMRIGEDRNVHRIPPRERDFLPYDRPGHFWGHHPHYYGYRVNYLPPRYRRLHYWGIDYCFYDGIYYRPYNGFWVICRPPFGVCIDLAISDLVFSTVRFAYYHNTYRMYNAIDANNRIIDEQNRIIAQNNATIAAQNSSLALNVTRANDAYTLANRLGLAQSYAYANQPYYYQDGVFYIVNSNGQYEVIVPPAGALVEELPDDYDIINLDGVDYYKVDDTVYRTTLVEGKPYLEVLGQMYGKLAQKYNYDSNGVKYSNLY
ncbi:MAG: hypothetical protein J6Y06_00190 [Bacteroidales bacterium]|nr:hypothetical protein [Bacteroidales bacterium]